MLQDGCDNPVHSCETSGCSPSPILVWKLVKMRRPPEGQSTVRRRRSTTSEASPPRRSRWYHRPRLDWTTKVTVKLQLQTGGGCRIRVEARGAHAYFDGGVSLVDTLAEVLNQRPPQRET